MSQVPLRRNRDFVLRVTMLVLGGLALTLAVWTTASPSIRNAPSLSELDDAGPAATMEA